MNDDRKKADMCARESRVVAACMMQNAAKKKGMRKSTVMKSDRVHLSLAALGPERPDDAFCGE